MANKDHVYLGQLQDYYARYRVLPSYAGIGAVIGVSKRAAVKFVDRMIEEPRQAQERPAAVEAFLIPRGLATGLFIKVIRRGLP